MLELMELHEELARIDLEIDMVSVKLENMSVKDKLMKKIDWLK